ncbi:hypothetical protein B0J13DRAFT_515140 [Dactylonectria estremocensis]|uniref:Uncharacterized protein n=1 Tax=Dactylonectria estremocensis TaxID=1079267 RepID=A0A9P9IBZ0_9HYPO|nr:hypothetical protein B0J13DRAFT_515140 [Dactylonectria estremocensis]
MPLNRLGQFVLRAYLAQCLLAISAYATWTVTSSYALAVTTKTDTIVTGIKYTETSSLALKSDADPTGKPFSTSTYWDLDVEVVQIFYSKNDVDASDLQATTTTATTGSEAAYGNTNYLQEVVFTAPASCPTPFTVTAYTWVDIPSDAANQVTPTSTTTTISIDPHGTSHTYVTMYLSESAAPLDLPQSIDNIQLYYLNSCVDPRATETSASGGSNTQGDNDQSENAACSALQGCKTVKPLVASAVLSLLTIILMDLC